MAAVTLSLLSLFLSLMKFSRLSTNPPATIPKKFPPHKKKKTVTMVYMFMYLPNCAYLSVQEVQLYKLSKEKESIALEFKANFCFLGQ